jgi:hypothetical protein
VSAQPFRWGPAHEVWRQIVIREHRRALGRTAAFTASLALLVLGAAAPAHAEAPEQHCMVLLDDIADVAAQEFCADTFEEVDRVLQEETGLIRVESAEIVGARVTYTLATLYQDASYGGSSYTFLRSSACDGVTAAGIPDLGAVGLNDAVSSFIAYSSCQVRLYADISYGGSAYGYTTTKASLPTFNDVATSARVR